MIGEQQAKVSFFLSYVDQQSDDHPIASNDDVEMCFLFPDDDSSNEEFVEDELHVVIPPQYTRQADSQRSSRHYDRERRFTGKSPQPESSNATGAG